MTRICRNILPLLFLMLVSFQVEQPTQVLCSLKNKTTQNGEQLTYIVYYNVAGLYVNAGTALFSNNLERLNGKTVFHVVAEGRTNPSYDWIYKVRDRYESYIDTGSMLPQKFIRSVSEGSYKKYENINFNQTARTAITDAGVFRTPECIQDVISAMYYARNIDFSRYEPGAQIPFTMFLDNEVYNMYIRYLSKEVVKTKYGKFKAIKLKPLLLKGSIFEGGEKMTLWVSDDPNHIPLRAESPIIVGSVKIDMMSYRNLRYPLSSMKKFNGG